MVTAVTVVAVVAILVEPFFQLPKTAIAAATTTIYKVADVATRPNKTIVALFTHGKVNIKLLEM